MNGPTAVATPPNPDQVPMARARSSGWNDAWIMARLPGVSNAPPMPCRARAPISQAAPGARPHRSDADANHTAPTTKTRRLPYRSPREPPSRMNDASVSV